MADEYEIYKAKHHCLVATIRQPSPVTHSIMSSFCCPAPKKNLILARSNRLEIYETEPLVPSLLYEIPVRGTIIHVEAIPCKRGGHDLLFVFTEKYNALIFKHAAGGGPQVVASGSLRKQAGTEPDGGIHIAVHPNGTYIVIRAFHSGLVLIGISQMLLGARRSRTNESKKLHVHDIIGFPFLPTVLNMIFLSSGKVAVLWEDTERKRFLQTFKIRPIKTSRGSHDSSSIPEISPVAPFDEPMNVSPSTVMIRQVPVASELDISIIAIAQDHACLYSADQTPQRVSYPMRHLALPVAAVFVNPQLDFSRPAASAQGSSAESERSPDARKGKPGGAAPDSPDSVASASVMAKPLGGVPDTPFLIVVFHDGRVISLRLRNRPGSERLMPHDNGVLTTEPETVAFLYPSRLFVGSYYSDSVFVKYPNLQEIDRLEHTGPITSGFILDEDNLLPPAWGTLGELLGTNNPTQMCLKGGVGGAAADAADAAAPSLCPQPFRVAEPRSFVFCSGGVHHSTISKLLRGLEMRSMLRAPITRVLKMHSLHDDEGVLSIVAIRLIGGYAFVRADVSDAGPSLEVVECRNLEASIMQQLFLTSLIGEDSSVWHFSVEPLRLDCSSPCVARVGEESPRRPTGHTSVSFNPSAQLIGAATDPARRRIAVFSQAAIYVFAPPKNKDSGKLKVAFKVKFAKCPVSIASVSLCFSDERLLLVASFVASSVIFAAAFSPARKGQKLRFGFPAAPLLRGLRKAPHFFDSQIFPTSLRITPLGARTPFLFAGTDDGYLAQYTLCVGPEQTLAPSDVRLRRLGNVSVALALGQRGTADVLIANSEDQVVCVSADSSDGTDEAATDRTLMRFVSSRHTIIEPIHLPSLAAQAEHITSALAFSSGVLSLSLLSDRSTRFLQRRRIEGLPRVAARIPSANMVAVSAFGPRGLPHLAVFDFLTLRRISSLPLLSGECIMDMAFMQLAVPPTSAPVPALCVATALSAASAGRVACGKDAQAGVQVDPDGPRSPVAAPPSGRELTQGHEKGRLLVFFAQTPAHLELIASATLPDIVLSVAPYAGGRVAAGTGNRVIVFEAVPAEVPAGRRLPDPTHLGAPRAELVQVAKHAASTLAVQLDSFENRVLVGDIFASVAFLEGPTHADLLLPRSPASEGSRLEMLSAEYTSRWVTALALLARDGTCAVCDSNKNFALLNPSTIEDDSILCWTGISRLAPSVHVHVGEQVNALAPGMLGVAREPWQHGAGTALPEDMAAVPEADLREFVGDTLFDAATPPLLLGTVAGSLLAIVPVSEEAWLLLREMQALVEKRLSDVDRAVASDEFRAPETSGFVPTSPLSLVDGDVLFRWFRLSHAERQEVADRLERQVSVEILDAIVARLAAACA
eukprot:gnl/Chilomastix_cuspidata/2631.p1 GENE.gnl/Chilomastix_cuspidata/2631~~gnl/Chilomastix_cuspidata/2631.p1  ORF type:complete len:1378 (+),score=512.18 gnl/Chilomastix_cuspidata/2631:34-4167(+)